MFVAVATSSPQHRPRHSQHTPRRCQEPQQFFNSIVRLPVTNLSQLLLPAFVSPSLPIMDRLRWRLTDISGGDIEDRRVVAAREPPLQRSDVTVTGQGVMINYHGGGDYIYRPLRRLCSI